MMCYVNNMCNDKKETIPVCSVCIFIYEPAKVMEPDGKHE